VLSAAMSDVASDAICLVDNEATCAGDINVTIEVITHHPFGRRGGLSARGVAYYF